MALEFEARIVQRRETAAAEDRPESLTFRLALPETTTVPSPAAHPTAPSPRPSTSLAALPWSRRRSCALPCGCCRRGRAPRRRGGEVGERGTPAILLRQDRASRLEPGPRHEARHRQPMPRG